MGLKMFTPELIHKLEECVIQAEKLSANDPVSLRHVAMARRVYTETSESLIKLESRQKATK